MILMRKIIKKTKFMVVFGNHWIQLSTFMLKIKIIMLMKYILIIMKVKKLFKEINKLNKLINDTKTNNIKHSNLVEEYKNNFQKK